EPERARVVHARASAWHARQGDAHRAVDHAIAAGASGRAAELIWGVVAARGGCAHPATVERWLRAFRVPQIAARPELAFSAAQLALMALEAGDDEDAARLSARARALVADDDGRLAVLAYAASAFACAQQGEVQRARDDVAEARRQLRRFGELPLYYDAEVRIA